MNANRNYINAYEDSLSDWKCGVYLRLSREDGDKLESDSISNQRKIVDGFLKKNPELKVFDTYIDDGISGTHFNRKEIIRLLEDIKNRKVNCLIVKDLSRFGRDKIEMSRYLEIVFPLLKLRVISITENIDSYKNPESLKNALVSFKVVMNDEYCRDISNKVRRSFDMKRRRGDFIGSFAPFGYDKDPNNRHKLVVDPEAANVVKQIFDWFIEGVSLYGICRLLSQMNIPNPTEYRIRKGLKTLVKPLESTNGAWQKRTVQRMLQNRVFIGDLIQKKLEKINYKLNVCVDVPKERQIVVENNHEPIIDLVTFEKVQDLFKRNRRLSKNESGEAHEVTIEPSKIQNIFAGYVKCADCGRAMSRNRVAASGKTYYYYSCTSYRKWRQCSKHTVQTQVIEKAVLTILQKHVEMAIEMDELLEVVNKQPVRNTSMNRLKKAIEAKQSEITRLKKFLDELYPDMKMGLISLEQYLHFKSENEVKIASLNLELDTIIASLAKEENGVDASNDFVSNFKKYQNINALTREMVVDLINMIYIEESGGIRIEFKFQDAFKEACDYIESNTKSQSKKTPA